MAAKKPSTNAPRTDTRFESLISRLETIETLYGTLDALRPRQRELIDAADTTPLLEVLAERDRIVRDLQRADELFQAANEGWESNGFPASSRERDAVRARMESVSRLASKIAAEDEEDNQRLVRRRTVIAAQLSGLSTSRAATTAYGNPASDGPRFQDREV